MRIITHPDNVELLKRQVEQDAFGARGLWGVEIQTDRHLERQKPTGRYRLPDGRMVPRDEVAVPDGPFFEWGHSDAEIKLLLAVGLIQEETGPVFVVVNEEAFSRMWSMEPTLPVGLKWFVRNSPGWV